MACGVLFLVPLAVLAGAVVLRAAIALANRRLGPAPRPIPSIVEDEDDWSDYPIEGAREPERAREMIPTPGFFRAIFLVAIVALVNTIVMVVGWVILLDDDAGRGPGGRAPLADLVLSRLPQLLVGFVITSGLLAAMLPTRFRLGCRVTLFLFLIGLGVAAILVIPIYLVQVILD